jgi:hypothetical protein
MAAPLKQLGPSCKVERQRIDDVLRQLKTAVKGHAALFFEIDSPREQLSGGVRIQRLPGYNDSRLGEPSALDEKAVRGRATERFPRNRTDSDGGPVHRSVFYSGRNERGHVSRRCEPEYVRLMSAAGDPQRAKKRESVCEDRRPGAAPSHDLFHVR